MQLGVTTPGTNGSVAKISGRRGWEDDAITAKGNFRDGERCNQTGNRGQ